MTDVTQPPAGLWASLVSLWNALKGYLPDKGAVWTGIIYIGVLLFGGTLGAVGVKTVQPDQTKVIEAAVAETKQVESARADQRIAYIAENRDLDNLAEQCGAAVRDALKQRKK